MALLLKITSNAEDAMSLGHSVESFYNDYVHVESFYVHVESIEQHPDFWESPTALRAAGEAAAW